MFFPTKKRKTQHRIESVNCALLSYHIFSRYRLHNNSCVYSLFVSTQTAIFLLGLKVILYTIVNLVRYINLTSKRIRHDDIAKKTYLILIIFNMGDSRSFIKFSIWYLMNLVIKRSYFEQNRRGVNRSFEKSWIVDQCLILFVFLRSYVLSTSASVIHRQPDLRIFSLYLLSSTRFSPFTNIHAHCLRVIPFSLPFFDPVIQYVCVKYRKLIYTSVDSAWVKQRNI